MVRRLFGCPPCFFACVFCYECVAQPTPPCPGRCFLGTVVRVCRWLQLFWSVHSSLLVYDAQHFISSGVNTPALGSCLLFWCAATFVLALRLTLSIFCMPSPNTFDDGRCYFSKQSSQRVVRPTSTSHTVRSTRIIFLPNGVVSQRTHSQRPKRHPGLTRISTTPLHSTSTSHTTRCSCCCSCSLGHRHFVTIVPITKNVYERIIV